MIARITERKRGRRVRPFFHVTRPEGWAGHPSCGTVCAPSAASFVPSPLGRNTGNSASRRPSRPRAPVGLVLQSRRKASGVWPMVLGRVHGTDRRAGFGGGPTSCCPKTLDREARPQVTGVAGLRRIRAHFSHAARSTRCNRGWWSPPTCSRNTDNTGDHRGCPLPVLLARRSSLARVEILNPITLAKVSSNFNYRNSRPRTPQPERFSPHHTRVRCVGCRAQSTRAPLSGSTVFAGRAPWCRASLAVGSGFKLFFCNHHGRRRIRKSQARGHGVYSNNSDMGVAR